MDIGETLNKITELARHYPGTISIQPQWHDRKRVYKYIGKFLCPVDEHLLQFLLTFNRISLFGYSFMGIGDGDNVRDLYRFSQDCWELNHALTPYFLVFSNGVSGEIIGSLTNYKGAKQYPVAYLPKPGAGKFIIIGSGFGEFLKNLVALAENILSAGMENNIAAILSSSDYWLSRDSLLQQNMEKGIYRISAQDNWKLEFGFS
ncbi:MAG: hypothetical protein WDO71_04215 [Bacteroidota bacterium]